MKDYTNSNAGFSNKIKILETSDTNHADNINTTTRQLLDNTVANNREIEAVKNKLGTVESGAGVNVQPDWNVTDQNSDAYIKNKPSTFPASAHSHDDKYYPKATVDSKLSEKANSTHTHNYAPASHTHSDYAKTSHTHNYAPASHTHSNYAAAEHTHSGFAATTHTHSNYALTAHTHNYASANHTHDENYYTKATVDSKLSGKASSTHTHSGYALSSHKHVDDYAPIKHTHDNYLLTTDNPGVIKSKKGFEISYSKTESMNPSSLGTYNIGSAGMRFLEDQSALDIYAPPFSTMNTSGAQTRLESVSLRMFGCAQKLVPYCAKRTSSIITLGTSSRYFDTIYYATKGTPSDRNLKKNISALSDDRYIKLFDKMLISMFQYKGTNPGMTEPDHSRYHLGVIAQDLEEWIWECGLDDMEFSPVKATFFIPNTSDNRIAGGWRAPYANEEKGIIYDYSENVWNYKHDQGYQVLNEVIEMPVSELEFSDYRENIQYLLIEDNAKVSKEHYQPPVKINSIHLIDKEGNLTQLPLNLGGLSYYEQDDKDFSNPLSEGVYDADEDSITITFDKMYGTYLLKISELGIRLKDYETVIIDVDFIGEYKMYFLPACEMVNANVWDRKRNPKLIYDYAVDYEQLYLTAMYVLQETRKEFMQYKSDTEKKFDELEQRIIKMEGGV
ncbi:MAG: hypothetical protein HFG34_02365 [Eubacterium sp.]|nr:hypothetical protein [Eubacterium sp.]